MIKVFPFASVSKQIPYIRWLEQMLESVSSEEFCHIARPLFALYANLAVSDSSHVAEASFRIWENPIIAPMMFENSEICYHMLHLPVMKSMRGHWQTSTQSRAMAVLRFMQDCDPLMFKSLLMEKPTIEKTVTSGDEYERIWSMIVRAASRKDRTLPIAKILTGIASHFKMFPEDDKI
jgi:hypothetical protein